MATKGKGVPKPSPMKKPEPEDKPPKTPLNIWKRPISLPRMERLS